MTPENGQRILEPFYSTKLESGGTGLGLSISASIVKEHGGTPEFTSQPDRGTTFVVRLPAAFPVPKELHETLCLDQQAAFASIVTRNWKMRAMFQYLEVVAGSRQPIIITGETGARGSPPPCSGSSARP